MSDTDTHPLAPATGVIITVGAVAPLILAAIAAVVLILAPLKVGLLATAVLALLACKVAATTTRTIVLVWETTKES